MYYTFFYYIYLAHHKDYPMATWGRGMEFLFMVKFKFKCHVTNKAILCKLNAIG